MNGLEDFFARLHFTWYRSRVIWTARANGKLYVVEDQIYERVLSKQLTRLGIERKSYCSHMRPYEEEWRRQCQAVDERVTKSYCGLMQQGLEAWERQCRAEEQIQRDLDFWAAVPGVEVRLLRGSTYGTSVGHAHR